MSNTLKIQAARLGKLLFSLAVLAGVAGCVWHDKGGTHHLILGLGYTIVTTTNRPGVEVCETSGVGLTAAQGFTGLGWQRQHRVTIDPQVASNLVLSVQSKPGQLLIKNYAINFLPESELIPTNQTKTETKPQHETKKP
jgi:hypothetical protein